jgi:integrase
MAKIRTRGSSYVLDWSDASGQHRKTIGRVGAMSARQAEAVRLAKELELNAGIALLPGFGTAAVPTLAAFAKKYLGWFAGELPDTYEDVRRRVNNQLVPALGHYPLDAIPLYEAEQWKHRRVRKVLPSTANLEVRTLRAMLNKAVEWGIIARSPLPQKRFRDLADGRAQVPLYLTRVQLGALYDAAQVGGYAPVWKLLANTGLRRAEALQLRWADVAAGQLTVVSRADARTKTRRMRAVPLNQQARGALAQLKLRAADNGFVLPQASRTNLTHRCKKHMRLAGLPEALSLHSLRHTFASHLVMAGVPLRTVQVLMGHSRIEMTEVYASLAPEHLNDHVNRIDL